jgi:hypothetical protein
LTRITGPLPKLDTLEFVLDTPKVISKSVAMARSHPGRRGTLNFES